MNLNQEQANKLARVLLEANSVEELSDRMLTVFGKAEQPPDVSHLLFEGCRVEIAEHKKRLPKMTDIALNFNYNTNSYLEAFRPDADHQSVECWILRTIPLSVYGCGPKSVDLSNLRGPNWFPVEWVDFREPNLGDLYVSAPASNGNTPILTLTNESHLVGRDTRRIIVREVKPKARQWIATECFKNKDECKEYGVLNIVGSDNPIHAFPLADLDDIKVQYAIAHAVGWSDISISERAKLVAGIRHYLFMNPIR